MKTRIGFVSNSSSTCFLVLKDSAYYKRISGALAFHEIYLKMGDDLSRSTGVYEEMSLIAFVHELSKYLKDFSAKIKTNINKYGMNNVALVMISDEDTKSVYQLHPNKNDSGILFEQEYH